MYLKQMRPDLWRVIVQHAGKRASATAPTRSAAELLGAELLLELGGKPKAGEVTVAELLDHQLAHGDYRPTTHADLTRVRNRLPPTFLARSVASVEPVVIDGLYRQLGREGWTPHRIHRVHGLLGAAFAVARRFGWTKLEPTRHARLPDIAERDNTTPDVTDVQRILAAAPADMQMFLLLAATCGARRGELCALRWEDIDETALLMHIRRAASYTPTSGLVIGDVKTGKSGRRVYHIDTETLDELYTYRRTQTGITPWLFTHDLETCWRPDYATHRFCELRDSLSLHHVRLHDLRHFVATELIGGITDARTAASHLGHARPSMTTDRYAKALDQRARDAASEMRRRVRGG